MDTKYKIIKQRLKNMCRPAVVDLCTKAGLTPDETKMILMFYTEQKDIDSIADSYNMARNTVNNKKKILINRIMDYEEFISIQTRANGIGGAYVQ